MAEENTNITENEGLPTTKEELAALLQKEGDKRVSEAMKKAEAKKQNAIAEAEKLARMNEAEKFQYQLEEREKAIAAKEKDLVLAQNTVSASKILSEKGLPVALVDLVVADDAEVINERIKGLETAFTTAVKAEVENRLKNTSQPRTATNQKPNYSKMSLAEIQASLQN